MKFKWLKRVLIIVAALLGVVFFLLSIPRIWSALNYDKPPLGYYFIAPVYPAVWTGLERLVNLKPGVPSDIKELKNIEYKNVNGKSLQLDMYIPDKVTRPAPLLVFIHGGGWRSGQRSDYLVYLIAFAKKGYITATVSYRLLADSCYPACVEDISDAAEWFFNNGGTYGYDPDRIALIGGSAGGHLALLTAYGWKKHTSDNDSTGHHRIKAVVDIYGPYDMTTEYARNHSLVTSFLAHSYEDAPELYRESSPEHYLEEGDPPTLIFHGTSDDLVPVSQSDSLAAKLGRVGIPCVYYRLPWWPHMMDMVKRVNDFSQEKMSDFFDQYLK